MVKKLANDIKCFRQLKVSDKYYKSIILPLGIKYCKRYLISDLIIVRISRVSKEVTTRSTVDYASVTSIIHCRPCCNFLISRCRQKTPE